MHFAQNDYSQLSDSLLLSQLAQGDPESLKELHIRYAPWLYQIAMKRLPVAHKAEDLVQEVFLALYRNRGNMHEINSLRAWLSCCLRNLILNEIRNIRRHEHHHSQIAGGSVNSVTLSNRYDMKLLEQQFRKALSELTDRCRMVFMMSRVEELPNTNIAEKLNCSVKAVEKQMTKALRIMRSELGEHRIGLFLLLLAYSLC